MFIAYLIAKDKALILSYIWVEIDDVVSSFLDDGYLWMWGWGSRGQLGQGEMKNLNTPTKVEGFK